MEKNNNGVHLKLLLTYLHQNVFNIKKRLTLVLKKICKQSAFSAHFQNRSEIYKLMQYFNNIKAWMRILQSLLITFSQWGSELANFWLVDGSFFILLVRETLQFLSNSSQNFKVLYLIIHVVDSFLT